MQRDWPLFKSMKERIVREWAALPRTANVISTPLAEKIQNFKQHRQQ